MHPIYTILFFKLIQLRKLRNIYSVFSNWHSWESTQVSELHQPWSYVHNGLLRNQKTSPSPLASVLCTAEHLIKKCPDKTDSWLENPYDVRSILQDQSESLDLCYGINRM